MDPYTFKSRFPGDTSSLLKYRIRQRQNLGEGRVVACLRVRGSGNEQEGANMIKHPALLLYAFVKTQWLPVVF